jgi:hypothetical protein
MGTRRDLENCQTALESFHEEASSLPGSGTYKCFWQDYHCRWSHHEEYLRPAEGDFTAYFMEELKKEQENVPSSLQETIIGMLEANTELKIPECDPALLEEGETARIFHGLMRNVVFTTSSGHFGTGDDTVEPGDLVCVLFGGNTPFVLRGIDNHYILVGECYVHGMMHGEAMAALESGEVEEEWFELH